MVKIRLQGLKNEVELSIEQLKKCFKVVYISDFYKNSNSDYVRCYVEVMNLV